VWLISRVSDVPQLKSYELQFTARHATADGFVAILGVKGHGRRHQVAGVAMVQFGRGQAQAYGVAAADCPEAVCSAVFGGPGHGTLQRTGLVPETSATVVAATNVDVQFTVARGWRVTRLPGSYFRRVLSSEADTDGADVDVTVSSFRGAKAAGGPNGSLVLAPSACASAGTGSAILSGGNEPDKYTCPAVGVLTRPTMWGAAPGRTEWRVTGDEVGVSQWRTRLAVIDLPRGHFWS
jgi:hypothetical protein